MAASRRIIIFGCSGQAKVIADIIEQDRRFEIAGLIDSFKIAGTRLGDYSVLGTESDLPRLMEELRITGGLVGIGDNFTRWQMTEQVKTLAPNFEFFTAIHPAAVVAKSVKVGAGSVVMAGAIINPGTLVGAGCIVNTGATVDHDCVLGDFSCVLPRACLGGNVHVGRFSAVCLGANIIHGIRVGDNSVLGAGATLVNDLPDEVVAYGTPARVIRARKPGEKYL